MITYLRNKALKRLGLSLLLLVMTALLAFTSFFGIPQTVIAVGAILLLTFAFVFYIQGNIALANARGYDDSSVAAIVITAVLCTGGLFFMMPFILFFGFKDRTKHRRSHRTAPETTKMNPLAKLPPRREE